MTPAIVAGVLALVERVPRLRFRALPVLRPYFGTDVVYLLTGYVAGGSLALAYVMHASAWTAAWTGVEWASVPLWLQIALALVMIDFGNYVVHWALHRFDALWRFHAAHHSSQELDWMATFRSHLVEQALRRLVAPLGAIALGLPAEAVVPAAGFFFAWAILNHANVALPVAWLEPLFVTPRLHRLHHVPATSERNLGTVLSVWDRLLGRLVTYDVPRDVVLGLPRGRDAYPQTWVAQLVAPFRAQVPADPRARDDVPARSSVVSR
jgi:sterol desaturase/sphingolipid hydroxylase (fatty acid hydroxylase superfamily)